jgi:hypothetical protein
MVREAARGTASLPPRLSAVAHAAANIDVRVKSAQRPLNRNFAAGLFPLIAELSPFGNFGGLPTALKRTIDRRAETDLCMAGKMAVLKCPGRPKNRQAFPADPVTS